MSQATPSNRILNQFVDRARTLHTLPAVAVRVLELTNDPQVDIREVKQVIETDPALTSKILRTVNSSLFGAAREIYDLSQAMAMLGTTPLKMLVLGFSLPKNLFDGLTRETLENYWKHTLIKAVAAKMLAHDYFNVGDDEAYIAGLLQGLGQLILIQELEESYVSFLDRVLQENADLTSMEQSTLGFAHATLSARLLDHWGFPRRLVRAVGQSFAPQAIADLAVTDRALPQVLHLAELIARLLTQHEPLILQRLLELGDAYCGLNAEQLSAIIGHLGRDVPALADIYSISIQADYDDVLAEAYNRLSDVSAEAAGMLSPSQGDADNSWHAAMDEAVSRTENRSSSNAPSKPAASADAQPTPSGSAANAQDVDAREADAGALDSGALDSGALDSGALDSGALKSGALDARAADSMEAIEQLLAMGDQLPSQRSAGSLLIDDAVPHVARAIAGCRQSRAPLSLLLVELLHADDCVFRLGPDGFDRVLVELREALVQFSQGDRVLRTDDSQFAVVLPDHDRSEAVSLGRRVMNGLVDWLLKSTQFEVPVGVGVASLSCPPRNFPATDLLLAAQRCLNGARQSGGGIVKSIDL